MPVHELRAHTPQRVYIIHFKNSISTDAELLLTVSQPTFILRTHITVTSSPCQFIDHEFMGSTPQQPPAWKQHLHRCGIASYSISPHARTAHSHCDEQVTWQSMSSGLTASHPTLILCTLTVTSRLRPVHELRAHSISPSAHTAHSHCDEQVTWQSMSSGLTASHPTLILRTLTVTSRLRGSP